VYCFFLRHAFFKTLCFLPNPIWHPAVRHPLMLHLMPKGIDLPAQAQRRAIFRKRKPERVYFIKAQGIGTSQLIVRHCTVLHPFGNINNYSIQDLQLILYKRRGAAPEVLLLLCYDHLQPFNGLPWLFMDKTDIPDWTGTRLFIIFGLHNSHFLKAPPPLKARGFFRLKKMLLFGAGQ
jgi:hypothetical protein